MEIQPRGTQQVFIRQPLRVNSHAAHENNTARQQSTVWETHASYILMWPSSDAVVSSLESGENARDRTGMAWPENHCRRKIQNEIWCYQGIGWYRKRRKREGWWERERERERERKRRERERDPPSKLFSKRPVCISKRLTTPSTAPDAKIRPSGLCKREILFKKLKCMILSKPNHNAPCIDRKDHFYVKVLGTHAQGHTHTHTHTHTRAPTHAHSTYIGYAHDKLPAGIEWGLALSTLDTKQIDLSRVCPACQETTVRRKHHCPEFSCSNTHTQCTTQWVMPPQSRVRLQQHTHTHTHTHTHSAQNNESCHRIASLD